jgi:hypothetical protein
MKLVIPHKGEFSQSDARLVRLAQFLGIDCEPLFLENRSQNHAQYIANIVKSQGDCLVVNPKVIASWTGNLQQPGELISCLLSRFQSLLVYGVSEDPAQAELIRALSRGQLSSVQAIPSSDHSYCIAPGSGEICGPFAGVSFGPINTVNDRIFCGNVQARAGRVPISIGGHPFMALLEQEKVRVVFLASADTADVNEEVGTAPLSVYFSRFVPHAMALRYIFGDACWHPREHHASMVIDDPLLWPRYGFIKFEELLRLMHQYNLFTTIAFIPHNYRRNSTQIVRMFNENRSRFGLCFHGNDHTLAEFASTDLCRLNTAIRIAEARMAALHRTTGLSYSKVMVFPQGKFSVEAMKVLKARNFFAAVNSAPHPSRHSAKLTLGDLSQPAVMRYGQFPLFLRSSIRPKKEDISFNLFFGRPVLVEEHHDVFRRPETMTEAAVTINSVARGIHWSDLETGVSNSILERRMPDGTYHVRAFSGKVRIANDSESPRQSLIEWNHHRQCPVVAQVLQNGTSVCSHELSESAIKVSAMLPPRSSQVFSVLYRNDHCSDADPGFRWKAKVFIRRRIAEAIDNYVSKNEYASNFTKALRHRARKGK